MNAISSPAYLTTPCFFYEIEISSFDFLRNNMISLYIRISIMFHLKPNRMKKLLLCLTALILFCTESYSQATFSTGAMDVGVSQYGRIRLYTPDGTRQLQRASILVATAPDAVFDYQNDAEELEPTILVANPTQSDFEIYGAYDNAYSGAPPDVIVKLRAFGWTNESYTIVKFNIYNDETAALNAEAGLDIIPEINQEYGFDTVTYNAEKGVIRFHRGNQVNMGMKLLSAPLTSLYSFEWYDGYEVDTSYWNWMHFGSLQPHYFSTTVDGPVTITSQAGVSLAPGASFNVYYALALGADETAMLANIAAAEVKYQGLITGVDDLKPAAGFSLDQNSPNPVRSSTSIRYQIPEDGFVTLRVYNVVGNEVASLVNSNQQRGTHTITFNANDLSSGLYFYKLTFGDQVRTNKMFVVK